MTRTAFALASVLLLVATAFTAMEARAVAPVIDLPQLGAGVGETWVLGVQTIDHQQMSIQDRLRVMPGAKLVVESSTLTFADDAASGTGLVAEPGSIVELRNSTLQAADGARTGTFTVNLQGMTTIANTLVTDPREVVLNPRPVTDQVAQLAPAQLHGQVLGEASLAAELAPGADVQQLTVLRARGTGLVLGAAPVGDRVHLEPYLGPAAEGTLHLDQVEVTQSRGPGIECYATDEKPSLGGPAPVLGPGTSRIQLTRVTLTDNAGGGLYCSSAPAPRSLPPRVVPITGLPPVAPLDAAPSPAALPFGGTFTITSGALRGPGTGIGFDAPGDLALAQLAFDAFATGLDAGAGTTTLDASTVDAGLGLLARGGALTVTASTLHAAQGARAAGGQLSVADSTMQGTGSGIGLDAQAAGASLDQVTVRGFATGVQATAPFSMQGGAIAQSPTDMVLRGTTGGSITGVTFHGGTLGVLLDHSTGATLQGNGFFGVADPLLVLTDTTPVHAHFDHSVLDDTVDGRQLSYVLDRTAATIGGPTGHIVAAFSSDVRWTDVDLAHGKLHATATGELVLAAPTSAQGTLLGQMQPAARPAFDQLGQLRFKPYPGSMLSTQAVLDSGYANDLDAARALADLWGQRGLQVRFVDGQQAGPTAGFLNWIGMRSPNFAFAMQGLRDVQWFGPTYAMSRTWLEVQAQPGVWVEADPSYHQYAWSTPLDVRTLAHVSSDDLGLAAAQGASLDYATHSVQGANISALFQKFSGNDAAMTDHINATGPLNGGQLAFVGTARTVLPSEDITRTPISRSNGIAAGQDWEVHIVTQEPGVAATAEFDFQASLRSVYGKRISIGSYPDSPAEFQKAVSAGSLYNLTPAAINYTTFLFLDGQPVDAIGGSRVTLPNGSVVWQLKADAQRPVIHHPGDLVDLQVSILRPGGQVYQVHDSPFRVGGTYAIVLDLAGTPAALVERHAAAYRATLDRWGYGDANVTVSQDDLYGELVQMQGLDYFSRQHAMASMLAAQNDVVEVPLASVAMTGTSMLPASTPSGTRITVAPPYFDILNLDFTYPRSGNVTALTAYNLASGAFSSALEDKVFAEMYSLRAVSTIKVLTEANAQGVRLYHINGTETQGLSHLALPNTVLQSIVDAVNRGQDVVVPERQISYYNWTGVGWIEYDTQTGGAGWLIYGGTTPLHGQSLVEPVIQRGGAGAEYGPGENKQFPDWGYSFGDKTGFDWGLYGVGSVSDAAEKGLRYSILNSAANDGRRFWDGVALNNDNRALLGKFDVPGQYGKYFGYAGNVVTVVGQGADMWKILNNGQTTEVQVTQMVGVTAVNVGTVLVGEEAIVLGAEGGALIGGLIGDGPGAVLGAVVGGVGAAFGLGYVADKLKGIFFGL